MLSLFFYSQEAGCCGVSWATPVSCSCRKCSSLTTSRRLALATSDASDSTPPSSVAPARIDRLMYGRRRAFVCARAHVLHVVQRADDIHAYWRDLRPLQFLVLGEQRHDRAADVAGPRLGLVLVREREVDAMLATQARQARSVARDCRNHRRVRQLQARRLSPAVVPGDPVMPHGGPAPIEALGLRRFNIRVNSQQLGLARRHGHAV
eukprot:scaffold82464_cov66-Phaeocystis_antarctica.AAC.4